MGAEPGGLGAQDGIGGNHSGLEADGSLAEVLLGVLQVGEGHLHLFAGLAHDFALLSNLQADELAGILVLSLVQCSFGLRLLIAVHILQSVEDGHVHHDTGHERTTVPGILDAVEGIGIGDKVISREGHLGHHIGPYYLSFFVINLSGQLEAAGLGTVGIDVFQGFLGRSLRLGNHVDGLIGQHNLALQGKADALAKQHLGQGETVIGLGEEHPGFVHLNLHLKGVGLGGNAGGDGLVHIGLHLQQEVKITLGQFLLVGNGDDLPISLIHVQHHVGVLHVVFAPGQIFGQGGHLVGINYLSAYEHRLLHAHGTYPDIVEVRVQGFVNIGPDGVHRFGDIGNKTCQGRGVHSLEHFEDGLPHGAAHVFGSHGGIGLDGCHELGHALGHTGAQLLCGTGHGCIQLSLHQGSCILQQLALGVAD